MEKWLKILQLIEIIIIIKLKMTRKIVLSHTLRGVNINNI